MRRRDIMRQEVIREGLAADITSREVTRGEEAPHATEASPITTPRVAEALRAADSVRSATLPGPTLPAAIIVIRRVTSAERGRHRGFTVKQGAITKTPISDAPILDRSAMPSLTDIVSATKWWGTGTECFSITISGAQAIIFRAALPHCATIIGTGTGGASSLLALAA